MRQGGEPESTVFPRDDHAEETLVLDVLPRMWRQIVKFLRNLPIAQHPAQFLYRPFQESPLFRGKEGFRER
jgi:hypothetical protein